MILNWEAKRYGQQRGWLARRFNSSVAARRRLAIESLKHSVTGRTVLELGCGSGQLAPLVLSLGARHYIGVDLSAIAIEEANRVSQDAILEKKAEFHIGSVATLPAMKFDFCFSLGLLDWLADDEIRAMIDSTAGSPFLHSFSENRPGDFLRQIHERYVHLKYGHRQRYVPRYLTENEIRDFFGSNVELIRHPEMRFGAFVRDVGQSECAEKS